MKFLMAGLGNSGAEYAETRHNVASEVLDALKRNGTVYFCACGGAGALIAGCVTKCDVIAFDDLGPESIKRLEIKDMPVIVGADSSGNTVVK